MKRLITAFLTLALLIACQPTPENETVGHKDTDALIESVTAQQPDGTAGESVPPIEPVAERYTGSYVSEDGFFTLRADADVSVPASGKIPMARVKATGFSDEFAKNAFDLIYQGNPVYTQSCGGPKTKSMIAEEMAYYQKLVNEGRTDEIEMDEQSVLETIEELKEVYKNAPDELTPPEKKRSDGTMETSVETRAFGKLYMKKLEINDEIGYLFVSSSERSDRTPVYVSFNTVKGSIDDWKGGCMEDRSGRDLCGWYDSYETYRVRTDDAECAYGQSFSPKDAADRGLAFFRDLGLTDIQPVRECDMHLAKTESGAVKVIYFVWYTRKVNGEPTAYVPLFQIGHAEYELPWHYEYIQFEIGDDGIQAVRWDDPVEVTEVLSDAVGVLSFAEAKDVFEKQMKRAYGSGTDADSRLYVDAAVRHVELCPIRIREQNADGKTGLYVPAWVFYGTLAVGKEPIDPEAVKGYSTSVLLVVNAVNGTIIDLDKGY